MSFSPLLLALAFVTQGAASDIPSNLVPTKPEPTKILATVNGEPIRASDVEALLWEWRAQDVLEDVILYRLVKQEANKAGAKVEDAAVEKRLSEFMGELKAGLRPGQTVEELLQFEGSAPSRLYLRLKTEMLLQALATKSFDPNEFVNVSTIIYKPDSERTESVAAAIKRAEEAYEKLSAGGNWEETLAASTQNENALRSKGNIGWRQLSAFPTSVQPELRSAKVGGLTKPVQTVNGIQIFRVEAKGVDAKDQELTDLKNLYGRALLEQLRSQAKIDRTK
jgi:hypothetical protein